MHSKILNNMFIQRPQIPTAPRKELKTILRYLGKMSQIVKTRLTKTMNKHIKFCKLRVIFQTNNRLRNYFRFKDFINFRAEAAQLPTLVRPTNRHFKVRVSEHQGVSPRIGKPVKGTLSTFVRDQMLICDHKVVHEYFKFLGNESNRYLLELKESLFIKRDKPSLIIAGVVTVLSMYSI